MRQLDLFAGIDGLGSDLTKMRCEIDLSCQAVLRYHYDEPIIEDIAVTKSVGKWILDRIKRVEAKNPKIPE